MLELIIKNPIVTAVIGGIAGVFFTWLRQQILNKRGVLTYTTTHNRVGFSSEDAVFGSVRVTWNERNISNLYISTIELVNESMNDYENILLSAYSGGTELLTEQTKIGDGINPLQWSEHYKGLLHVPAGKLPTDLQRQIYAGQRAYVIPVLNRGQKVSLNYLHSVSDVAGLGIWLAVEKKGVKLKERKPQVTIHGISAPRAALVGILIGICLIPVVVIITNNIWTVGLFSFVYGLIAQSPGAYIIKCWRALRGMIGG